MFKILFSSLRSYLYPLINQEPVAKLIRTTAIDQWRVVLVNILSSILESLTEGATLGLVFLAVEVMSSQSNTALVLRKVPFIGNSTSLFEWLTRIPSTTLFLYLLCLALLVQLLQGLSRFANSVSVAYLSARIRTLVTSKIHAQILRFSFACASKFKVGDLVDYAGTGPDAIRVQIEQTSSLVVIIPQCLTYIAVLLVLSPWMVFAVLVVGFTIYQLQKTMIPRIRAGSYFVSQEVVSVSMRITEDFQGLRLLHTSGQLNLASDRLLDKLFGLEKQLKKQAPRLAILGPISTFLPILAITLIAGLSIFVFGNRAGGVLPSLVTFVLALQRLTMRITMIGSVTNTFADNSGRLKRLNYILSPTDKQFRKSDGEIFFAFERSIVFDNVSLSYDNVSPPALKNVSFTLRKGSTVALVGPSGAGKSTIADILVGLYAPTSGVVTIDDLPLEKYQLSSWQSSLGVVSQDTFLFNASIRDNISFGMSDVPYETVVNACKLSQADDFIQALPDGYSTIVGERGYRLSGGQRQRLSLARALIRNPQLLILDEATSALDSQNEMLVQSAIRDLDKNYTILVIAHRLSTIVGAHQILVMDRGSIVQSGTHRELLNVPGLYHDLWLMQSDSTS